VWPWWPAWRPAQRLRDPRPEQGRRPRHPQRGWRGHRRDRSLAISQRLLGIEIVLIHPPTAACSLPTTASGVDPEPASTRLVRGAFGDLDTDVRQSIARIKASPFVPKKDSIRGFVFDVAAEELNEVV
jgi:carbonic anhydrase